MDIVREQIFITGRVQGVGFRPTVVRLAGELSLTGTVFNDTQGVVLELQGRSEAIETFLLRLQGVDKPPLATIVSCEQKSCEIQPDEQGMMVVESDASGAVQSEVAVDTAICRDCLQEMRTPHDFRYRYPFINCTNCGPRYSIVQSVPYDRPRTTMAAFPMCVQCEMQYTDVQDRRYHAQPVACANCGPHIWLTDAQGDTLEADSDLCLVQAAERLRAGDILGVKGIGGFHLAVDAFNNAAVERLRERKQRDHKPFALMGASLEALEHVVTINAEARALLASPLAPIVLLPKRANTELAASVAPGMNTLGCMLCHAPLHFLLFEQGLDILVMTSGNISDAPLICDNQRALERLGSVADAFLMHNRDIYRQVDDSIVHQVGSQVMPIRRSRGYMPTPLRLAQSMDKPVLAVGADLKNTFCLGKGDMLIGSEHMGDLADAAVYRHYVHSVEHLKGLFEVEPETVVHDLHPGYVSTQFARSLRGVEHIAVQHHWAHIAAVLAEHQVDEPVIGIVADGTGYGTDGAIWGGECLIASLTEFQRWGHVRYFTLPGGDRASQEAIRPLMGLLHGTMNCEENMGGGWLDVIEPDTAKRSMIQQQIDKGLNTISTSSVGRIFDAVAALVGVGQANHFDAQLPMELEALAGDIQADAYPMPCLNEGGGVLLDWAPMMEGLIADKQTKVLPEVMAARFHQTWIDAFGNWACHAREGTNLNTVALSGGVFCNRRLLSGLILLLENKGFRVLVGQQWPANDACISIGQAAIACRTQS